MMTTRKKRTTWWDLLDKETREHVRKEAGVRSAAGLRRTIDTHNASGFFCFYCRLAAWTLREHRPDLDIPAPLTLSELERNQEAYKLMQMQLAMI
jgi:hypothetical protein